MRRITEWLFPPRCAACASLLDLSDPVERDAALCRTCGKEWINRTMERCETCGKPVSSCSCMPTELTRAGCSACFKLTYYQHGERNPVQNRVIFSLKKNRNDRAARFLATSFLPAVRQLAADGMVNESTLITYIPRGKRAVRENGVDQAKELARAIAKTADYLMMPLLARTRAAEHQQKDLNTRERKKNAASAFRLRKNVSLGGLSVILVDDIVTSGASAGACVKLLLGAGAASVAVLCIAEDDLNRKALRAPVLHP